MDESSEMQNMTLDLTDGEPSNKFTFSFSLINVCLGTLLNFQSGETQIQIIWTFLE